MDDDGETFQPALFDIKEPWEEVWLGMPEFDQQDLTSKKQIIVHFSTMGDLQVFAEAIGQPVTKNTRSVWFPPTEIGRYANKRFKRHEP